MTKLRDDKRANVRREFALHRSDGTPVGSTTVTYLDGCSDSFTESGDLFHCAVGGQSHEPGSHTRANWWIRGPYRFDDDYDDYSA